MTQESELGGMRMGETAERPFIRHEYYPPSDFDPALPIQNGGIEVAINIQGQTYFGITSHYDTQTRGEILRILAAKDEGEPRNSVEELLRFLQPRCLLTPSALTFDVSGEHKLVITPEEGVVLNVRTLKEDGTLLRRNFSEGKKNSRFASGSSYLFEATTLQKEAVIEEDGVEYGAEISAGIKFPMIDITQLKKILDELRRLGKLTPDNAKKFINPYFKIRLKSLEQMQKDEDEFTI